MSPRSGSRQVERGSAKTVLVKCRSPELAKRAVNTEECEHTSCTELAPILLNDVNITLKQEGTDSKDHPRKGHA
ncbi:hypothetical protein MRX96_003168 [Rhipicephalus microplus]